MLTADERKILERLSTGASSRATLLAAGARAEVLTTLEHLDLLQRVASGGRRSFSTSVEYELTAEGQARLPLVGGGLETLFIRLGRWCSCGFSWNAATPGLEKGVSVFECVEVTADQYLPSLDHAWRKNAKDFRTLARKLGKQWYLVGGTRSGLGGDQEPLLTEIEFKSPLVESGGSFGLAPTSPNMGPRQGQDPNHQACGGSPCP